MHSLDGEPTAKSLLYQHDSAFGWYPGLNEQRTRLFLGRVLVLAPVEARARALQRSQSLLKGFGEVAADCHRLTDALHGRGQRRIRRRELLEREPWHLDHDVVQGRLETGGRHLGDVVGDLVQRV